MLRKTMIVLATAAALTGGLSADAFARGGGGHMGGGGGGAHMGGGFGGGHMGGRSGGFGSGMTGQHFAGARGRFDHDRRFGFGPGDHGFYDYGCSSGYPITIPTAAICPPTDVRQPSVIAISIAPPDKQAPHCSCGAVGSNRL
jgi:hypothetical protein